MGRAPMAKITELLDLQLLAIPIHIAEADLNGEYRDETRAVHSENLPRPPV